MAENQGNPEIGMQAEMELTKKKEQAKTRTEKEFLQTQAEQNNLRGALQNVADLQKGKMENNLKLFEKQLQMKDKND